MGACYSVTLLYKVKNESGAIKALQSKIAKGSIENVDYSIDMWKDNGVGMDTLDDLMRIIFGGFMSKSHKIEKLDNGFIRVIDDFDASYGWESVMIEAFNLLAPNFEEGSELTISPDSDYDYLVVEGGKSIMKH